MKIIRAEEPVKRQVKMPTMTKWFIALVVIIFVIAVFLIYFRIDITGNAANVTLNATESDITLPMCWGGICLR